jgi:hypothetical protein
MLIQQGCSFIATVHLLNCKTGANNEVRQSFLGEEMVFEFEYLGLLGRDDREGFGD